MCFLESRCWFSPFSGSNPPGPHFVGVNRLSEKKPACYQNYCIDSNQIMHNIKDHHVILVDGSTTHRTNPIKAKVRGAILKKKLSNRRISTTVGPILIEFGLIAHNEDYSESIAKTSNYWKFKIAAAFILKIKKSQYLSNELTDFYENWRDRANWVS